ncbi:MAG: type I DNA topoisomerase [Candidatus Caenarcaniphilales bacterium]|nr:type I DNA topoisomerase [Candidatus Caenarcaniphilales bacterium]
MNASKKSQSLVIVESPAKAKTIGKILGSDYRIESSVGHIRDLPVKGIGVNTRKNFEPVYEIMPGKEKVVEKLLSAAKDSAMIYLATDPDREGEAIAWHLSCVLDVPAKRMKRVMFNEITQDAVREAFTRAGEVNSHRVAAQQARRVLDRLVGYKVSPLIQRKIGGRSAGRVQSVAVRLICEREEEIEAFNPLEYWSFAANLRKAQTTFLVQVVSWQGKRIVSPDKAGSDKNVWIQSKPEADQLIQGLPIPQTATVKGLSEKKVTKQPNPPFITSTLQRTASSVFGFGVKKTMQIAQQLYEGIDINHDNTPIGLITYMRTDSTRISDKAQDEAAEFITEKYGAEFLPAERKQYSKKKDAQDAHEAIRPTYVHLTPDSLKSKLTSDQYRLYKLIWERFMASQMAPAQINRLTVEFEDEKKSILMRASTSMVTFAGFQKAFQQDQDETETAQDGEDEEVASLPPLEKGERIEMIKLLPKQHFTEPPPRFNEASLVKTLEELGIGRPSTYAAIISTIQDRKYVEKNESKSLAPTKLGRDVNKVLVEHFGDVFEARFTAAMESKLDEIEQAHLGWQEMVADFYNPFKLTLKEAQEKIEAQQIPTDISCEKCSTGMMMVKSGRWGPFLGCSNYPDCDNTMKLGKDGQPVPPPRESEKHCPKCESQMMITSGRFGDYLLCPNPDCAHKMPIMNSIGIKCPKIGCTGEIVEKKSRFGKLFFGCSEWSNTKCDAVFWNKPLEEHCPKCDSLLTYKTLKRGDKVACSNKECDYERLASEKIEEVRV